MVDWTKLRGWKYDHHNTYLEVWVDGTEVARFDDASTYGLRLLVNGLDVTGGIHVTSGVIDQNDVVASTTTTTGSMVTAGGIGIAGNLWAGGTVSVIDEIKYSNQLVHANATVSTIADDTALDANDCGKVIECAVDGVTITLPSSSVGLNYTIVNTGTDSLVGITIDPAAGDWIRGGGMLGDDGGAIINTKDSHIQGDMISLLADSADGWYVTKMHGTWTAETA